MLDPLKVAIDHNLVVLTLAMYVVGTLLLTGYFLMRTPLLQRIGAIVLVLGLCISFYLLPARLYVVITGAQRSWNVGIAATTVKGYDIFEDRFREIVEALRRTSTAS